MTVKEMEEIDAQIQASQDAEQAAQDDQVADQEAPPEQV